MSVIQKKLFLYTSKQKRIIYSVKSHIEIDCAAINKSSVNLTNVVSVLWSLEKPDWKAEKIVHGDWETTTENFSKKWKITKETKIIEVTQSPR